LCPKFSKMLVSNITVSVEPTSSSKFEELIKHLIVELKSSNINIKDIKTLKLLTEIHTENITYAIQFHFEALNHFEDWDNVNKHDLFRILDQNIPNKYVYFQTLLEGI
jgi:Domain of unknown function (DUF4286)